VRDISFRAKQVIVKLFLSTVSLILGRYYYLHDTLVKKTV